MVVVYQIVGLLEWWNNMDIQHMTDRQLLEWIYLMQIQILNKLNCIDDDSKQFSINLAADLMGTIIATNKLETNGDSNTNNSQVGNIQNRQTIY